MEGCYGGKMQKLVGLLHWPEMTLASDEILLWPELNVIALFSFHFVLTVRLLLSHATPDDYL